jgi:hypothetical protein
MPFTFAHPAAAVPLLRPLKRYGVLSALVIGSFAPDLGYFLPFTVARVDTHSLSGLIWFCLPVSALSYILFHRFMKEPLLDFFPAIGSRLWGIKQPDSSVTRWLAILISFLCGSMTHLIWDAFTHERGLFVRTIPVLHARLFWVGRYPVYGFNLLQHLSTIVGLVLILWWTWRWLKNTPAHPLSSPPMLTPFQRSKVSIAFLAIPAAIGIWFGTNGIGRLSGASALEAFAYEAVFSALPILALEILFYCASWQIWRLNYRVRTG